MGGVAYGIPRKASTGGSTWVKIPLNNPYFVLTILELYRTFSCDVLIVSGVAKTNMNQIIFGALSGFFQIDKNNNKIGK